MIKYGQVVLMMTEEFSFPIINSSHPTTVLPPLWRISSVKNWGNHELEVENGRNRKIFRRSFSEIEEEITKNNNEEKAKAEEKMDLLWEDFNEELLIQGSNSSSSSMESDFDQFSEFNDGDCVEEFGSVEDCSDKRSRGMNMQVMKSKKKNLVLVGKMLKKLFLLQSMARTKNRDNS